MLQGASIAQLEILDLDELEIIESIMESGGPGLAELLTAKGTAGMRLAAMNQYLSFERGLPLKRPARLNLAFREAMDAVLRWFRERELPDRGPA